MLGIPAACFVDLARANVPRALLRAAEWLGFPITQIEETMKVVSPLAMPARVAPERPLHLRGHRGPARAAANTRGACGITGIDRACSGIRAATSRS